MAQPKKPYHLVQQKEMTLEDLLLLAERPPPRSGGSSVIIDTSGSRDKTYITTEEPDGTKSTRAISTPKGELPESEPGKQLSQAQADYLNKYIAEQSESEPVFSEEQYYADTHSYEVKQEVTPVYREGKIIGYQDPYSKHSVLLAQDKTVTESELQNVSRTYQARETMQQAVQKKEQPKPVEKIQGPKDDPFTQRVKASQKRQEEFYNSPGFQRIKDTASFITLGGGKPYDSRSWFGKYSETIATGLMSWPIALGGTIPMIGEKLAATGEGLSRRDTRENVFTEYKRTATSPDFLKTFDIRKPEGAATYTMAAIAAFPKAYYAYQAKQQPVVTGHKVEVAQRTVGDQAAYTVVKNELTLKIGNKNYRVSGKGSQKSTIRDSVSYDYGSYTYKAVPYKTKSNTVRLVSEDTGGIPTYKIVVDPKAKPSIKYQWDKSTYIDQDTVGYTVAGQGSYTSAGAYQNYNVLTNKYDTGIYGSRGETILVKDGLPTYKTLSYTETIKIDKTGMVTTPKEVRGGFSTQTYEIQGAKATSQGWINTETVAGASYFNTLPKYGFPRDPNTPDPILRTGYETTTASKTISVSKTPPNTQLVMEQGAKTAAKAAYMGEVTAQTQGKTAALSLMTAGIAESESQKTSGKISYEVTQPITKDRQEIRPQLIEITGDRSIQEVKPISIVDNAQRQRPVSITGPRSEPVQEVGQLQQPIQEVGQQQRPTQITQQIQRTTTAQGPQITPGIQQQYTGAFAMFKPPEEQRSKKSPFSVMVRRNRIFKEIGTGQTAEEAFTIGKQRVKTTAAASFKVTQAGQTVRQPVGSIFYESMKEPGVYIQKPQFRISSPGEKKEITFKGLLSRKIGKFGGFKL